MQKTTLGMCLCAWSTVCSHLPFQPTVLLTANPLLQSNWPLDWSLNLPCVFPPQNLCPHHLPLWNILPTSFHPTKSDLFLSHSTPTTGRPWASTFTCFISSCKAQHNFFLSVKLSEFTPTGSGHFLLFTVIVCSTPLALNTS